MYPNEENILMTVRALKQYGIRKIIISPGATNVTFVRSLQIDDYFELYSSVDERSAAYMACGLAVESGEPVALSCTGATASRNYIPGLTEAFYRKLPVIAITSTQKVERVGQLIAQVIDRSSQMNDIVKCSVLIPTVDSEETRWGNIIKLNKVLNALKNQGGGPVHINLETVYSSDYTCKVLPEVRKIDILNSKSEMPSLNNKKVYIFVGAHKKWDDKLTESVDSFCEKYDSFVICDHSSNYKGKYRVLGGLIGSQDNYLSDCLKADVMIHIGEVTGASYGMPINQVWRVSLDGEIRDPYKKLKYVFCMEELDFFNKFVEKKDGKVVTNNYERIIEEHELLKRRIPELPFSNAWIAQVTSMQFPENSVIHFGILNSLRMWSFFELPKSVLSYANTGGFGIDGGLSSLVGASFADDKKMFFGVFGDLATFYDLNVLGNRHIANNVRIIVVNNGCGTEFKNYNHPASAFKVETDDYIAAYGHFGKKSHELLAHFSQDLGFLYIKAETKEEYLKNLQIFLNLEEQSSPVIFEIFTNSQDESDALKLLRNLVSDPRRKAKESVKKLLGESNIDKIRRIIH